MTDAAPCPVIAVIGMHRSGTSLAMQALGALGAEAGGALLAGNDYNTRGYWEAGEIVAFHDRVLTALNRSWGTPEHLLPLPEDWQTHADAEEWTKTATALLAARLETIPATGTLALKDPRMTLVLPLWQAAAKAVGRELRVVLCLRHPAEVAASLARRDGTPITQGAGLWLSYTAHGLAVADRLPLHLLPMQAWHDAPEETLAGLGAFIGRPPEGPPPFATDLTQSGSGGEIPLPLAARWWKQLSTLPAGPLSAPDRHAASARAHLESAAAMDLLARAIRTEVGQTPSQALTRDLESWRRAAEELRTAYETEAAQAAAQGAQAREFLAAYQAEAATSAARAEEIKRLRGWFDLFNPKRWLRPRR